MQLLHADYFEGGTSRFVWTLRQDSGEESELDLPIAPVELASGMRVTVTGEQSAAGIAPSSIAVLAEAPSRGPGAATSASTANGARDPAQLPADAARDDAGAAVHAGRGEHGRVLGYEQHRELLGRDVVRQSTPHGNRDAVADGELHGSDDLQLLGHRDRGAARRDGGGLQPRDLPEVPLPVRARAGVRLGRARRSPRLADVEQPVQHARRDRPRARPQPRARPRELAAVQRRDDRHQLPARAARVRRSVGHHGQPELAPRQRVAEEQPGLDPGCQGRDPRRRHGQLHAFAAHVTGRDALRGAGAGRGASHLLARVPPGDGVRRRAAGLRDERRDHPSGRAHAPVRSQRIRLLGHVLPRHGPGDIDDDRRRAAGGERVRRRADRRHGHRSLEGRGRADGHGGEPADQVRSRSLPQAVVDGNAGLQIPAGLGLRLRAGHEGALRHGGRHPARRQLHL